MKKVAAIIFVLIFSINGWGQQTQAGFFGNLTEKAKTVWTEFKSYWNSLSNDRVPSSTTETNPVQPEQKVPDTKQVDSKLPEQKPIQQAEKTQVQKLQKTYADVKTAETHKVVKQARIGAANIPKSKSGVPVFALEKTTISKNGKKKIVQVKDIPLLDIGTEAQISRTEWSFELPKFEEVKLDEIKKYESPSMSTEKAIAAALAVKYEKAIINTKLDHIKLALPEDITMEVVQKLNYSLASELVVKELPYKEISEEKMNLIIAIVLAEYAKKCHLAMGYFQSLSKNFNEAESQLKSFYTASCMHELGFYSDSVPALLGVIKNGVPEFASKAIDIVTKDLPREYVKEAGGALKGTNEAFVAEKTKDLFNYYIALSESMKKKHESALAFAVKVKAESPKYPEAQYVAVVSEYMLDKVQASQERQEKLLLLLPKYKVEPPLAALIKLNLGRIAYRNKDYKKAIENYQFIDKDSPLWIQALTEQGWMQLLAKDPFGAVGNMHSLQSPYFEVIYKPESYVVRTIGYLNICQYGDAYKSLTYLEKFYKPWLSNLDSFKKSNHSNEDVYNYVISTLKTKGKVADAKLPMTIVKEVSRRKEFVNLQVAINNTLDQKTQYAFIRDMVKKDQKSVDSKIAQLKSQIVAYTARVDGVKKHSEDQKNLLEVKANRDVARTSLNFNEFLKVVYQKSYNDYRLYEEASSRILEKREAHLKSEAGEDIKENLAKLEKTLNKILENNEFLRYEVFAGSGENIRYISAGGKTEKRLPVNAEPKIKNQSWDFDGEFWADEIGHYRSSLKDNCPQSLSQNKNVN